MQTDLTSVYISIAPRPLSRPIPDCLNPPNGMLGSTKPWQLTQTVPALIFGINRWTACRLFDQMLALSPYEVRGREHGGLDEVPGIIGPLAAGNHRRAFGTPAVDVLEHALLLFGRYQWTHLRRGVEAGT
jgi:hypothetical protein